MPGDRKESALALAGVLTGAETTMLVQGGLNVRIPISALSRFLVLSSDVTIYVRPDGNDVNDGSANDAAHAFLTITAAIRASYAYNGAGYAVTIQLADATYNESLVVYGTTRGNGTRGGQSVSAPLIIKGNTATPANVIINDAASQALLASGGARVVLDGVAVNGVNAGVVSDTGSYVEVKKVTFKAVTSGPQMWAKDGGKIYCTTSYTINGNATAHFQATGAGSQIYGAGNTITVTAAAYSVAFAKADVHGVINHSGGTFSGSPTGKRFLSQRGSAIYTNGAGITYFPGTIAGTMDTSGKYDDLVGMTAGNITTALGYTPAAVLSSDLKEAFSYALSDETTALTTGTKTTLRFPFAFTVLEVRGSLTTAATGTTLLQFDVKKNGVSIFSTKPTFDASEDTTVTAATPAVISTATIASDDRLTFDITAIGNTTAGAGLKVTIIGYRTA